jgi:hypothetical protein
MFKKLGISVAIFTLSMSAYAAQTMPAFSLLPNIKTQYLLTTNANLAVNYEKQAIELVKKTLNITAESPYQGVRIRLIYDDVSEPKALIVYLLSNQVKRADIVKIILTKGFTVSEVIYNYTPTADDLAQSPAYAKKAEAHCPDEHVQFVIGNNFYGDRSVEKEVQATYQMAKDKGYNPVLMDVNDENGPQPTVTAYENWLSCQNVKGFYNESHGYEKGILLSDSEFVYSVVDKDLVEKMTHDVVLFDSCETFHDPLLSAMTKVNEGDSQQYVAGIISLPFGSSERTATCIWENAFNHQVLNKKLIKDCSKKFGLDPNGYGVTGNGDTHLTPAAGV